MEKTNISMKLTKKKLIRFKKLNNLSYQTKHFKIIILIFQFNYNQ